MSTQLPPPSSLPTSSIPPNTTSYANADPSTLYRALTTYPFSTDPIFQSGLSRILNSNPSHSETEYLILQAQCFYYSRKRKVPIIDPDAYQEWRRQQDPASLPPIPLPNTNHDDGKSISEPATAPSEPSQGSSSVPQPSLQEQSVANSDAEPSAPYPTSFSQIVELITSGQPIPGIIDVPDTTLEGQASQHTASKRRKPWEVNDSEDGQRIYATVDVD